MYSSSVHGSTMSAGPAQRAGRVSSQACCVIAARFLFRWLSEFSLQIFCTMIGRYSLSPLEQLSVCWGFQWGIVFFVGFPVLFFLIAGVSSPCGLLPVVVPRCFAEFTGVGASAPLCCVWPVGVGCMARFLPSLWSVVFGVVAAGSTVSLTLEFGRWAGVRIVLRASGCSMTVFCWWFSCEGRMWVSLGWLSFFSAFFRVWGGFHWCITVGLTWSYSRLVCSSAISLRWSVVVHGWCRRVVFSCFCFFVFGCFKPMVLFSWLGHLRYLVSRTVVV